MSTIRDALHKAADLVADAIEQSAAPDWIDQDASPLGRRRHLAAVRSGALRGHKEGNRVLVKRADLDAFLLKREVRIADAEADEGRAAERALREIRRVG